MRRDARLCRHHAFQPGDIGPSEDRPQRAAHRTGAVQRALRTTQQLDPIDIDQVDVWRYRPGVEACAGWRAHRRLTKISRHRALAGAGHAANRQSLLQRTGVDRVQRRCQPGKPTQVIGAPLGQHRAGQDRQAHARAPQQRRPSHRGYHDVAVGRRHSSRAILFHHDDPRLNRAGAQPRAAKHQRQRLHHRQIARHRRAESARDQRGVEHQLHAPGCRDVMQHTVQRARRDTGPNARALCRGDRRLNHRRRDHQRDTPQNLPVASLGHPPSPPR